MKHKKDHLNRKDDRERICGIFHRCRKPAVCLKDELSARNYVHIQVVSLFIRNESLPQIMMNNRKFFGLALGLAFALSFPSVNAQDETPAKPEAPAAPAEKPPLPADDDVVLLVDKTPITARDVRELFTARYGRQFEQMPPEQRKMLEPQIQRMVVSELINKTLLLNAANTEGMKATDEEVNKSIDKIKKSVPEGTTLEDFAKSAGVSIDRIKAQIVEDTKIKKLVENVTIDTKEPTDEAIKTYYDEHPDDFKKEASIAASHILISTQGIEDEGQLANKKMIAEELQTELVKNKGANFTDLATAHSDCPSKAKGGSLGTFGKGQMVPEFETAAFSQEVGAVGDLVKTDFGYHIIKVDSKQKAETTSFEDVKEDLGMSLFSEAKAKALEGYVQGLREKADVQQPTPEGGAAAPEAKPAPAAEEKAATKE